MDDGLEREVELIARGIAYGIYLQTDSGVYPKWSDFRDEARAILDGRMVQFGQSAGQIAQLFYDHGVEPDTCSCRGGDDQPSGVKLRANDCPIHGEE